MCLYRGRERPRYYAHSSPLAMSFVGEKEDENIVEVGNRRNFEDGKEFGDDVAR